MHTLVLALALLPTGCTSEEGSPSVVPPGEQLPPAVGTADLGATAPSVSPEDPSSPPPVLPPFSNPPLESVPLFGGTMEAVPSLDGVLAADPEGDRLVWMPVDGAAVEIPLGANARPFRIEVSGTRAWTTLRGSGEVLAVDLPSGEIAWHAPVCPEPRGLDHAEDGSLVVACAGGELLALDDTSGEVLRWKLLDSDLRDVVAADGVLYVSRFRPGEVLLVDPLTLEKRDVAPLGLSGRVAWRMRDDPTGEGTIVVYDEPSKDTIEGSTGGDQTTSVSYGTTTSTFQCEARHQVHIARVLPEGYATTGDALGGIVLPVDFFVRADGTVALANGGGHEEAPVQGLVELGELEDLFRGDCTVGTSRMTGAGLTSALAEVGGRLYVQTASNAVVRREAAASNELELVWEGAQPLPDDSPVLVFHRDPGTSVSCASCHPEGQDDGNVWRFGQGIDGVAIPGLRRTLPLAGRIAQRAPYHWMGELPTPGSLVESTFESGMGGPELPPGDSFALFGWIDGLRPVHRTSIAPPELLAQGEALFESTGCTSCHAGEAYTNNAVEVVREGPPSKTPTLLGLGMHTSFLHDGCAPTLLDRFLGPEECTGGDLHGAVSLLTDEDVVALVAWLETL